MSTASLPLESSPRPLSIWALRWRALRRHKPAMASLVLLLLLAAFCFSAPLVGALLHVDPNATDLFERYGPPTATHLLGTDEVGRDVLLRLMVGGQVSLAVGVLATVFGGLLGIAVGVLAGYLGGRIDAFLMRATDCMISLPLIPLLVVLAAIDLGKLGIPPDVAQGPDVSFWRIVIIIALVDWTTIARVVRAGTLAVGRQDYVLAARVSGAGTPYNVGVHVLPNVATPIIVAGTLTVGRVILLESTLSFLGVGVMPPTPTWGNMLNNAQELASSAPMLAVWPGLLIFLTVIAFNFLGDGLRVAFDPRATK
ncbi:ABC transporter permease [Ramlibacter sp. G-1-2-2]|uniref:ABC transporter permease n=1 Tax=Ramlibacter agri TaxID=2728837 RepID=A0A848GZT7_9BURK|nr:ABC transporter permease [Ramlibacter agri]NML42809.1 ABC transporter permease [Ramlibacter agri]